MKTNKLLMGALSLSLMTNACFMDDGDTTEASRVELKAHSTLGDMASKLIKLESEFSNVQVMPILSSEDRLVDSPDFVYGSMADGAGLMKNSDGTFSLINNIEADYSIARVNFDETFKPVSGEYIVNAEATAYTAQCSGTLITPEEHGFGPLYLSGGEWGGASKGVFATDPSKSAAQAGSAKLLPALGQWSTENAVPLGKNAYPSKTVVFIGDDHADNEVPSGQLGMYVGDQGDLEGGKLYGLKVTSAGINYEMDMEEGQSYEAEFVELEETAIDLLDEEAKQKGVMGFSRLEDIDYRRGSASNNREIYLAVTGRKKDGLVGKGSLYGRIYKVELNENDPTGKATITCVLDGDKLDGKAKMFHSPDNILVTENYAYIQEDPNGYPDTPDKDHYARLYQYDLSTGALKTVLEANQVAASQEGIGTADRNWEITGMIDVSKELGVDNTFLMITQNHGWEPSEGQNFTDPKANSRTESDADAGYRYNTEGSILYVVQGLAR